MELTQEQIDRIDATDYGRMVNSLAKPGEDILADLTVDKVYALSGALGRIARAADELDAIKKVVIYNKPSTEVELPEGLAGVEMPSHFNANKAHLIHMLVGIAGEVGELIEGVVPYLFADIPMDEENIVEELGDLEFYLEGLRQGLDFSREQTLKANKHKLLGKRYASGAYSDEQAQARADKEEA